MRRLSVRHIIGWGAILGASLMFCASAQPKGEVIFSAYVDACTGVRPQSDEDAALACIVLREDREATKVDIVGFSKSLCGGLNRACETSESRSRVPRILTFGLLAGCLDPLPACGGKDDNYLASTPFGFAPPNECLSIGGNAAAAQLLRPRAGSGARLLVLLRDATGREVSWSQQILDYRQSSAELELARAAMQQACSDFSSTNKPPGSTSLLDEFSRWLRTASGWFERVDDEHLQLLRPVAFGPRG